MLNPIGGKVIFLGQTLAFTATASDADTPPQTLRFTLDTPAPAGAVVSSAGAFTWIPTESGSFPIVLRVTDSGLPPLSAADAFTVDVLPLPAVARWVSKGGTFEFSWNAHAGQRYVVDCKDNLNAPVWAPLWTNLASGDSLSFTNVSTNRPQRFYRIRTE
jgi:hypothetical protein